MTMTIAQIASKAVGAVQGAITDAIPAATLTRTTNGAYTVATDTYATTTAVQTGRAVFQNISAVKDQFPDFIVGATDQLILLEGFTSAKENDVLTIGGVDRTIKAVQDLLGAGTLFNVIAR